MTESPEFMPLKGLIEDLRKQFSEQRQIERAALKACLEYEEQAMRIKELTEAIGAEVCPQQSESDLCHGGMVPGSPSCFAKAAQEQVDVPTAYPDEGPEFRRMTLDEIEEEVKDCPSCTKLVAMIRERKEAKKRWGVAKRRVRSVGKRAKEAGHDS